MGEYAKVLIADRVAIDVAHHLFRVRTGVAWPNPAVHTDAAR
jgi:hypothetical protein